MSRAEPASTEESPGVSDTGPAEAWSWSVPEESGEITARATIIKANNTARASKAKTTMFRGESGWSLFFGLAPRSRRLSLEMTRAHHCPNALHPYLGPMQ